MNEGHDTERLDALLAQLPHIDDDGFTDRTLAALPRPRRGRRWSEALYLLFTCIGLFLGLIVFPGAELVTLTLKGLMQFDLAAPQLTIFSLVLLATAVWAGWRLARE